jgi:hypothetical protein
MYKREQKLKTLIDTLGKSGMTGTRSWASFGNSDFLALTTALQQPSATCRFSRRTRTGSAFFVPDSNRLRIAHTIATWLTDWTTPIPRRQFLTVCCNASSLCVLANGKG